ncbi:oligoendopeptidase F [Anseongella ginsenosidimutans]|uniref:Oligoendopeptidase F n=1 Tax=Anseongella ginsenosidimutans TaxID=496056 RepID=A0A4R3KX16_9SPHI|nr:M3 family oligoendopeptidase [Anseongella ginsenosidimutans]QEC50999.1 M3 family oligoendopeptidase [Anseongella ginsenosidimutans]TCS90349.1 oligoendopeptidase F [Anseongella ginsenosidimutans]
MSTPKRNYLPAQLNIDFETLRTFYEELLNREITSAASLERWLRDRSELEAALEEDFAWRYIKMTCDTPNESLRKDFEYFATEIEPKIAPYSDKLNRKLQGSPFREQLDKEKYFVYLRAVEKEISLFREENIPLFSQLQVEQQKYGAISGAMTVTVNEKEYTLQQAANFLKDNRRELRQEVFEKIGNRRLEDSGQLDELFDKLLQLRHQVALNAGYNNYRDYAFAAMGRFDYSPEDCFRFHEAIEKEIVPLLRRQAEKRRSDLGLDQLRPWDTEVDTSGKPALKPFQGPEELTDKSIACFSNLDPYFGACLGTMKARGLLDLESRKGKAPGGYNYPLSETGMPFIFMNSADSMRDLTTMVHEGGHAVHTFLTAGLELNAFKNLTPEIAELASMSMELLSMQHWDHFFDEKDDLRRAKREQLHDILKTLPWVATIDAFQHWLYTHPGHSAAERRSAWLEIFDRFGAGFTDWTGYEQLKGNLWQKQLHLFEVPFYYIEYGMAQLGAIAVWKNFAENPERAVAQYTAALKLGYTRPIPEIYRAAGIRFDFSAAYVRSLAAFVSGELEKIS